jgi:Ca2+-binding RTX toxin-like protein
LRLWKAVLVGAIVAAFYANAGNATAATCTYDAATHAVALTLDANETGTLYTLNGEIQWSGVPNGQCGGAATVANTASITVTGNPLGSEDVTLDARNGAFAPGFGKEKGPKKTTFSEIEISVDLGGWDTNFFTRDRLSIRGTNGDDVIALGADGASLNSDDDLDVAVANSPDIRLFGELGSDTITAQGGNGAGSPFTRALEIYGGQEFDRDIDGANTITGGDGNDRIIGGLIGSNVINGMAGDDGVFGSWGDDTLNGGDGADSVSGDDGADTVDGANGNDTVNGGGGSDQVLGGAGDDQLNSSDSTADNVDGGDGNDFAFVDRNIDTVTNVETISAF